MKDQDQLNVLGMLHYLIGGFFGVFTCFPVLYLAVGIAILNGGLPVDHHGPQPHEFPEKFIGWLLIASSLLFIFLGGIYATCTILVGRCLQKRRWRTFCIVMAALSCLQLPFGTAFGILTIYTLTRPSIVTLFGEQPTV